MRLIFSECSVTAVLLIPLVISLLSESVHGRTGGRRLLQEGACVPVSDVIKSRGDVTIFSSVLGDVGLDATLDSAASLPTGSNSKGSYTVLVPTDDAFLEYLNNAGFQLETLTTLAQDELLDILKSHIITGQALKISDFITGEQYPTLNNGKSLVLKSSIEPIVKEADIQACGAEVHIIDFVVSPDILIGGDAPPTKESVPSVEDAILIGDSPSPNASLPSPSPEEPVNGLLPIEDEGGDQLTPSPSSVPSPSPPPQTPPTETNSDLLPIQGEAPPSVPPPPQTPPTDTDSDLLPIQGETPPQTPPTETVGDLLPIQGETPPAFQPPSSAASGTACVDVASSLLGSRDDTKIFYSMVTGLGLEAWLQQTASTPYTIFVPTDETFLRSGIDLSALVQANPDVVAQILKNHIITGQALRQSDFKIGSTYTTMNDGKLLKLDTSIAPIMQQADVKACASMVHIIDTVLVPDFVDLSEVTAASSADGSLLHGMHPSKLSSSTSSGTAGTSIDTTYVSIGSGFTAVNTNKNGGSLSVNAISLSG